MVDIKKAHFISLKSTVSHIEDFNVSPYWRLFTPVSYIVDRGDRMPLRSTTVIRGVGLLNYVLKSGEKKKRIHLTVTVTNTKF